MRSGLCAVTNLVVTLSMLSAGFAGSAEASEPSSHVFELEYRATGHFHHWNIDHLKNRAHFDKEPDFDGRKIVKGLVPAGAEEEDYIGYACDLESGKLYLDLNRNRDLTDDPNGVFEAHSRGHRGADFADVRFAARFGLIEIPYIVNLTFRGMDYAYMTLKGGFSGEIEVDGKKWHVEVGDKDGKIADFDPFVVRPVGVEADWLRSLRRFPIPDNIFFGGRSYKLEYELEERDDKPVLQMKLEELQVPLGKVIVCNRFMKFLVAYDDSTLVVLDSPENEVNIPLGTFRYQQLILGGEKSEYFTGSNFHANKFSVIADEPTVLKAGGRLTNSVSVERSGGTMTLKYRLVDSIGNEYASMNNRRDNPPVFAVYKGDKQVGSGKFEYG